jgi:hypothetical protein
LNNGVNPSSCASSMPDTDVKEMQAASSSIERCEIPFIVFSWWGDLLLS